ncbi:MAG: hypothetical protein IAE87_18850 [Rhodobacteraceae bacterium]|jgi:hypothetical protein|nr:hypothetical protein [Paracoccaceae bacterium]
MRPAIAAAAAIPLVLATMLPAVALAACPGEVLLSCPIGRKHLELCLTPEAVLYSFGPKGNPELKLAVPVTEAAYQPWPGVGRTIWDSVQLFNGGITYEVWTSIDRDDPAALWEGGINVLKGEALQAELTCAAGSVTNDLTAIFAAKEAAGQCWSFDNLRWQSACP